MLKNIIAIFSIVLLLGLGYYLFIATDTTSLDFSIDQSVSAQLMQNSQLFLERQRQLQGVELDTTLLTDERFRALQSYEIPVPNLPVGREQIFNESIDTTLTPVNQTES